MAQDPVPVETPHDPDEPPSDDGETNNLEERERELREISRQNKVGEAFLLLPWVLFATPLLCAVAFVIEGGWWWLGAVLSVALSTAVLFNPKGLTTVPSSAPASMAQLTLWGRRFPVALSEGKKLLADYFPFYIGIIIIAVEQQNLDFVYGHVRCRLERSTKTKKADPASGGAVEIEVSATIIADPKRFDEYILAGGVTPSSTQANTQTVLQDIVHDVLGEALRQEGARRSFEEMMFAQERLTVMLIETLTSKEYGGEEPLDTDVEIERQKRLKKMRDYLREALTDGAADIHSLGVKVRRLNTVRVEPVGRLAEAAEAAAVEQQQRSAEMIETKAVRAMARVYRQAAGKDADGKYVMSFDRALQIVARERGKHFQEVAVQSSGNPLLDAATTLGLNPSGPGK